ncbi:MAG: efflux RND transporter periplasmic adaptor subunit [Proteobacteria bacterium]|nr:efflux RND transporter periplasmic adaptor subunit [Pseudomonadota bacterium]
MNIKIPAIFILGSVIWATAGGQTSGQGTVYYDSSGQIVSGVPASAEVVTVGQRQTGVSTILSASVVPYREVTFNAEVSGRVEYIAGREGDRFNTQEVLVAIGSEKLLARRGQVLANLNNANLALSNSQMQYGREMWSPKSRDINKMPGMGMPSMFDQLFTRNAASSMGYGNPFLERYSDLYSSGTQMGQAQGLHLAALSKLREIDASLRDTRTVSPFNGVIVEKMVEAGDTVQPGQPLLKYADLDNLQLSVEVPSRLISIMEQGMVVPAMLDFNHQYVDVRLAQIYPVGNPQRHTITVKFDLPIGISAWPGTYAEIMLPDSGETSESLIEIPTSAVVRRGSLPVVYAIKGDRRELRLVRLGASYAAGRVTVLAGLEAGERVLVNPPAGVTSGWHKQPAGIDTY